MNRIFYTISADKSFLLLYNETNYLLGGLPMATISLCMIVKNEEAVLDRCLSSIADLMDEIVIIDTGSTDRTKEIAGHYTDQIYDFPWQNDFSAARNFSFSKAAMDYIYTADADEVLDYENHKRFVHLKKSLLPEIEIVQMKYITCGEYNTVMNIQNEYRPKLYKRLRQFRWIDPIHETVQTQPLIFDSDIEILHIPQSCHSKRDFSLFLHAFGNGQPISDKLHSMYAKELFISGTDEDFLQAQTVFMQTLLNESCDCGHHTNESSLPESRYAGRLPEAICVLCRCMRIQNRIPDFFKYALRAMAYHPCSEICCELGRYFYENKDYEEAVRWYYCAANETSSILNVRTSGILPLEGMEQCYGQLAEACPDRKEEYNNLSAEYHNAAASWKMPEENDHF